MFYAMFETFSSFAPACCCCCTNQPTVASAITAYPPTPVEQRLQLGRSPRKRSKQYSFGDRLGLRGPSALQVQSPCISVDPQHDSLEVLRRYLAQYTQYARSFLGLTGTQRQVDAARKAHRVFSQSRDDPQARSGYVVPHSAFAYFIAPSGAHRASFAESPDPANVAARGRIEPGRSGNESV